MTDKEVGELWQRDGILEALNVASPIRDLIRKLVEERAYASKWECMSSMCSYNPEWPIKDWQKEARAQFGIPEEDWK